jgi:hypothetical protein
MLMLMCTSTCILWTVVNDNANLLFLPIHYACLFLNHCVYVCCSLTLNSLLSDFMRHYSLTVTVMSLERLIIAVDLDFWWWVPSLRLTMSMWLCVHVYQTSLRASWGAMFTISITEHLSPTFSMRQRKRWDWVYDELWLQCRKLHCRPPTCKTTFGKQFVDAPWELARTLKRQGNGAFIVLDARRDSGWSTDFFFANVFNPKSISDASSLTSSYIHSLLPVSVTLSHGLKI